MNTLEKLESELEEIAEEIALNKLLKIKYNECSISVDNRETGEYESDSIDLDESEHLEDIVYTIHAQLDNAIDIVRDYPDSIVDITLSVVAELPKLFTDNVAESAVLCLFNNVYSNGIRELADAQPRLYQDIEYRINLGIELTEDNADDMLSNIEKYKLLKKLAD